VLPARTSTLGLFPRPSSLGNGIYETNVPGVGIRISFDYGGFGHVVIPGNAKVNVGETYVGNARVQLIKTGRITAGGTLQSGNLGQAGYEGRRQAWVDLLDARVEVKRRTCAFLSKRVELNLGKVDGGVLAASGESHWATNQLVSTGCDGVTEMHLTFSGTPDDSNPHWFKLTGGGAATGVAIEFRSDHLGTPIVPNDPKPLVLRAWPEGRAYGFRARYRTTSKPLRPGSGNTHITVNVLYI
jgi:type 1 fimbria pilin